MVVKAIINSVSPCQDKVGGIYVHIPFCYRKCFYCNFYLTTQVNPGILEEYKSAICREIKANSAWANHQIQFNSIFFGGGSPSILPASILESILNQIYDLFPNQSFDEVTIECNPEDLTREKLKIYRSLGINRISIGVQTYNEDLFFVLGRQGTTHTVEKCLEFVCAADFDNISLDSIYGIPGQSPKDIDEIINLAEQYSIDHISFYNLTYGKGSLLHQRVVKHELIPMHEDKEIDLYTRFVAKAQQKGFDQYEISNFARKGKVSRHNLHYWKYRNYVGFGPSACSFLRLQDDPVGTRYQVKSDVKAYLKVLRSDQAVDYNKLSQELYIEDPRQLADAVLEYIYTALRLAEGLNLTVLIAYFGVEFVINDAVSELQDLGQITIGLPIIKLTTQGFMLHNKITLIVNDCVQLINK